MKKLRSFSLIGTLLIAIVVVSGCASNAGSYGRGSGGPRRMPMGPTVDEIIVELELAEEQAAQVRGVLEACEDERSEIMAKHAGSRGPAAFEDAHAELDGLRARTEVMLEPLLTGEQMALYCRIIDRAEAERERMAEEMKARRGMGRAGGRAGRPGF
jgi:hypothetical protein